MSDTVIADVNEVFNCKVVLEEVIKSIEEKGQDPKTQLAAYLISGEPLYITNHNKARVLIQKVGREELLEYLCSKVIESR